MIKQSFYIDKYDWQVTVLYEVDDSDTDSVISILKLFDANTNIIRVACDNIINNKYNNGFTYSDLNKHKTLIVVGKATSKGELINTIVHEANHLQSHIATKFNLDEKCEEVCYLIGGIAKTMFKVFNKIIGLSLLINA